MKPLFTFKLSLVVLACSVLTVSNVAAQQDKLPTAEDVLNKYCEVTGGVSNYKSIRSLKAAGTMSIPAQNMSGEMEMKMVMPGQMWMKVDFPTMGMTQVQGVLDGIVWDSNSMMGARLVEGKEADQLSSQTKMERFYDPKSYYKSMKNAGAVDVDGEKAYQIELEKKDGGKRTEFYSVKSGFLLKAVEKATTQMGEMEIVSKPSNYKKTGKFTSAHKMTTLIPAANAEMVMEFESYEYNAKVEKSELAPPADVKKLIDKKKAKARTSNPNRFCDVQSLTGFSFLFPVFFCVSSSINW